jgi:hypothetical protein
MEFKCMEMEWNLNAWKWNGNRNGMVMACHGMT